MCDPRFLCYPRFRCHHNSPVCSVEGRLSAAAVEKSVYLQAQEVLDKEARMAERLTDLEDNHNDVATRCDELEEQVSFRI
jgi:hypothetical protein